MPRPAFSPDEDALIREHYPDYTRLSTLLTRWDIASIRHRAGRMGLTTREARRSKPWMMSELRTLRALWPDYTALRSALPHRTDEAIKCQVRELGLTRGRAANGCGEVAPWTQEEIAQLHIYGLTLPGRTPSAIASARRRFGVAVDADTYHAAVAARIAAERAAIEARKAARAEQARAKLEKAAAEAEERRRVRAILARSRNPDAERQAGRKRKREAEKARRAEQARAAAQTAPKPVAPPKPLPVAPKPVSAPSSWRRKNNAVHPSIVAAAGRSRYGYDLLSAIGRAVPREVWPHIRPLVIEHVALAVIAGRVALNEVAGAMPAAVRAAMDLYLNPSREAA